MRRVVLAMLCGCAVVRGAAAAEKPGESHVSHRQAMSEHLLRDMEDTRNRGSHKAFSDEDRWRARAANSPDGFARFRVSEEDIDLLDEYYHLLRRRVRDDVLEIQNRAKLGELTDAEIVKWEHDRAELARLRVELATKGEGVKRLAELIYASVPGYSLREYNMLPEMYYAFNDETGALDYLGPASDEALAEMADLAIMADSALYVPWVEEHLDHYKKWLKKHRELYQKLTKTEPKIAAAVHGETSAKSSAPHVSSNSIAHNPISTPPHSATSAASHGSSSSWGASPARVPKTPVRPLPRPATPIAPRIGIGSGIGVR